MKLWRKSLITLSLLLLVGIVILGLAFWRYGNRYAEQVLIAQARAAGIALAPRELSIFWPGVRINALALHIPRAWIGLEASQVELRLEPSQLFLRTLAARLNAALYSGSLTFTAATPLSTPAANDLGLYSLELKKIALAEHPQLRALGISEGRLDLMLSQFRPGTEPTLGDLLIELHGFSTKSPLHIPAALIGQALPLSIPPLSNVESSIRCSLAIPQKLQCPRVNLTTPWGAVRAELGALLPASGQRRKLIFLDANISLSDQGLRELGPWLTHFSKGRISADTRIFRISGQSTDGLRLDTLEWQREG